MTQEQKQLFWDYEEIQNTIKELEEKRDSIKPQILELITVNEKVPLTAGYLTVECRKKWVFSPKVTALETELDELKEDEKQTGVATYIDGEPFMKYYSNKKSR
jgi:uncharacterized protein Yka (UPF0111/DUF47 family)